MNLNTFSTNGFSFPVCRTCLQNEGHLSPIFDSKAAEMLLYCNFCRVSEDDDLSHDICSNCLQILEQCFTFKQLCIKSESTLTAAFKKNYKASDQNLDIDIENVTKNVESLQENSLDSSDLRDDLIKSNLNFSIDVKVEDTLSDSEEFSLKDDLISFLDKPLPPPLQNQCEHCSHSFKEENDLKIHQSVHNPDLVCSVCSKKFTGRQTLKRHLKIHLTQKNHICKICNKTFSESYALVKHLRHHSGIPREKKHFCKDCGQGFSEPYYLKVHKRKHTGERPLTCTQCDKSFADPRSLKTHVMIHTGERPFKCNFCAKSFIQNANLTKHLRVHTGEKPYLCQICDKKFSQSSSLEKHLKVHSSDKIYKCDLCEKRYSGKNTLHKHVCKRLVKK